MLLIGDIHITQKYADQLIQSLRNFVGSHPNETSLIFVGDYVYHFSFDRKALLQLYSFFLELVELGKDVYVMAGNHDWIQEHFVYAESAKAFQLFSPILLSGIGRLEFITECCWRTIEEKTIFFVPFSLIEDQERGGSYDTLLDSANKQEQQSGRINTLVEREILRYMSENSDSKNPDEIYMIHHRYIEGQAFPGQQASFSYKSPALASIWLDYPGIKLISGHLHQAFSYKNYLCIGSIRYSSPLEYNQCKFAFVLHDDGHVSSSQLIINPYIHGSLEQLKSQQKLSEYLESLYSLSCANFISKQWNVSFPGFQIPPLSLLNLTIRDNDLNYDQLQSSVDKDIFSSVTDLTIKKQSIQMDQFVSLLETGSQQLTESIADRKTLLLLYIRKKYGERSHIYEQELSELGLI